jgi:hypothetical protein
MVVKEVDGVCRYGDGDTDTRPGTSYDKRRDVAIPLLVLIHCVSARAALGPTRTVDIHYSLVVSHIDQTRRRLMITLVVCIRAGHWARWKGYKVVALELLFRLWNYIKHCRSTNMAGISSPRHDHPHRTPYHLTYRICVPQQETL